MSTRDQVLAGGACVADALSGGQEQFATHLGKWPGILSRLLLVYHAIDAYGQSRHPGAYPVAPATVARVVQIARDYLFPHAAAFYGDVLAQRTHHGTATKLADIILAKRWETFSLRDVAVQWKGWRSFDERYQSAVVAYLELCGWIVECEPAAKPGRRPSDLFRVNPMVHERFAARAVAERQKRSRLRADWEAATHA